MAYEVEYQFVPGYHWQSEIAMLTGLPVWDVIDHVPETTVWYARTFLKIFDELGYNHDPRFRKFDPTTEKPCLMRFIKTGKKEGHWYSAVYSNGYVYACGLGKMKFEDYVNEHITGSYRITSMMRVWI